MPRDWDLYYSDAANLEFTPVPLLVEVADLLPPGRALDIASGPGRNAIYLASLGWHVTAVDSSAVAISILRAKAARMAIEARAADLETGEFQIEPESYDLVCDFFYLQRSLFPRIREGVRLGGVFTAAIHLAGGEPGKGPRNPEFLLQPGELRHEFAGWKIVYYSEGADREHTARIIARRA